tara:strand:- start:2 stop:154 length:153 start_codon:yes stop_codon:yes gene_type:complete
MDYLSLPDEILDKNHTKFGQKYRKESRRMDINIKAEGGVVDWKYILNDFI